MNLFSSKILKRLFATVLFLFCIILQSCSTIPEATADYDFVLGNEYSAPIKKVSDQKPPAAILLVPIAQKMPPQYYQEFVSKFTSYYKERNLILDPNWQKRTTSPTPMEIQGLVQDTLCDAILFLKLEQFSAYPPLRLRADVTLQLVKDDQVLWRGVADYDAGQEQVSNSARKFLQKQLRRPNDPEKSLAVLKNNYLFIHFSAWHLANHLNNLTTPPPDPDAPKEPAKEEKPKW